MTRSTWAGLAGAALLAALLPSAAGAIPVYSRKYATSCSTCHTVYPKLTAFGEAFRRNGYRFPRIDSDYIKQELIPMGQDAARKDFPNATWPSFMTNVPLLAFGVSGRMVVHPDTGSASAKADNRALVSLDRLANSATLYAAGAIDDNITVLGLIAASDTGANIDETLVVWSDLVGPRHVFNLSIGLTAPTLTPFARTSSYAAPGAHLLSVPATTFYGGTGASFRVTNKYSLAEVNGMLGGRVEYGVGIAAGGHEAGTRPAENVYGHVAVKLGGMRLDGEGDFVPPDPARPWTENAFTLYGFAYRSNTRYTAAVLAPATKGLLQADRATSLGGGFRAQVGSAEWNASGTWEDHAHVTQVAEPDGRSGRATLLLASSELSYVIYPWLVPAVRLEHLVVKPRGLSSANDTRILPVIGMQLRPNVKLAITGTLEHASGKPAAGGSFARLSGNGLFLDPPDANTSAGYELSLVTVSASFLF